MFFTYFSFQLTVSDGEFSAFVATTPNEWIHVVINYIGPDEQQGIETYLNGVMCEDSNTKSASTHGNLPGEARIIIGRNLAQTSVATNYASVDIDELLFFNATLTPEHITSLFNL